MLIHTQHMHTYILLVQRMDMFIDDLLNDRSMRDAREVCDGPFLSGNHVGDITTQLYFVVFKLLAKQDLAGGKRCLSFQKDKGSQVELGRIG